MKIVFCVFLVTLNTVLVTANYYTYNARTCDPNEIMSEIVNTWSQDYPCETGVIAGQMKSRTRSASPFVPQWSRHSYREVRDYSNAGCTVEIDEPGRLRLNDVTSLSGFGPVISRCEGNITYSFDSNGIRYNEFPVGQCFATSRGFRFITCVFNNTASSSTTTTTTASSVSGLSSPISAEDSSASTLFTHCWLSAVLVLGTLQSLRP
jgi:hypothetical protein